MTYDPRLYSLARVTGQLLETLGSLGDGEGEQEYCSVGYLKHQPETVDLITIWGEVEKQ